MKVKLRQRRTKLYVIRNCEEKNKNRKSVVRKWKFPEFESVDEKDTLVSKEKNESSNPR